MRAASRRANACVLRPSTRRSAVQAASTARAAMSSCRRLLRVKSVNAVRGVRLDDHRAWHGEEARRPRCAVPATRHLAQATVYEHAAGACDLQSDVGVDVPGNAVRKRRAHVAGLRGLRDVARLRGGRQNGGGHEGRDEREPAHGYSASRSSGSVSASIACWAASSDDSGTRTF